MTLIYIVKLNDWVIPDNRHLVLDSMILYWLNIHIFFERAIIVNAADFEKNRNNAAPKQVRKSMRLNNPICI